MDRIVHSKKFIDAAIDIAARFDVPAATMWHFLDGEELLMLIKTEPPERWQPWQWKIFEAWVEERREHVRSTDAS